MICFRILCEVFTGTIAVRAPVKLGEVSVKAGSGGLGKGGTVKCVPHDITFGDLCHHTTQKVYFYAQKMCCSAEAQ